MVQDIESQIVQESDQIISDSVKLCGIDVDKNELIKALKYDRNQYSKGYKDGVNDVLDNIRAEIEQTAYPIVHGVNNYEKGMTLYGILQIIDNYKAKAEG